MLECVGVAFFRGKGAKLTGQNANVRIIDVAVVNVGREISVFPLADDIRHHSKRVELV